MECRAYVIVESATFEHLGDGRTRVTSDSLFHTTGERDGMLEAMGTGMDESFEALDRVLATMAWSQASALSSSTPVLSLPCRASMRNDDSFGRR